MCLKLKISKIDGCIFHGSFTYNGVVLGYFPDPDYRLGTKEQDYLRETEINQKENSRAIGDKFILPHAHLFFSFLHSWTK